MKQHVLILLLCLLFSGSVGAQHIEKEVRYLECAYELRSAEMMKKFAKRWQRRVRPNNHRAKNKAEKTIYDIYYALYDKTALGMDPSDVEKWYVPAHEATYHLLPDSLYEVVSRDLYRQHYLDKGDTASFDDIKAGLEKALEGYKNLAIPVFHPKLRYPVEKTFYMTEAYRKIMLTFAEDDPDNNNDHLYFMQDYVPCIAGHWGDPEINYNVVDLDSHIYINQSLDSATVEVATDHGDMSYLRLRKHNKKWLITYTYVFGMWYQ